MRISLEDTSVAQNDCWFPALDIPNEVSVRDLISASDSMTGFKGLVYFECDDLAGR